MPSAKVLESKKNLVAELTEKLNAAQSGVLVDYRGLTVEQDTKLRNQLREAGVEYKVIKNTMLRFAAKNAGLDGLEAILENPTSLAISADDPIAPASVLAKFAKENDALEIKGGFLEGKVVDLATIERLGSIPSKDTLIAQTVGGLNSIITSFAIVIDQIAKKKAAEEAAE